jgi:hypothetical protein
MQHKIILLLISFFPIFAFSQSNNSRADSANKIIMNGGDCSDRTYTKVQILPSLKISNQAFVDSVSIYLKSNKIKFGNGTIRLLFVVDCHSRITNIQKLSGNISDLVTLKTVLLKFSDYWLPARVNNYIVSSYVGLEMEFKKHMLNNITIGQ